MKFEELLSDIRAAVTHRTGVPRPNLRTDNSEMAAYWYEELVRHVARLTERPDAGGERLATAEAMGAPKLHVPPKIWVAPMPTPDGGSFNGTREVYVHPERPNPRAVGFVPTSLLEAAQSRVARLDGLLTAKQRAYEDQLAVAARARIEADAARSELAEVRASLEDALRGLTEANTKIGAQAWKLEKYQKDEARLCSDLAEARSDLRQNQEAIADERKVRRHELEKWERELEEVRGAVAEIATALRQATDDDGMSTPIEMVKCLQKEIAIEREKWLKAERDLAEARKEVERLRGELRKLAVTLSNATGSLTLSNATGSLQQATKGPTDER